MVANGDRGVGAEITLVDPGWAVIFMVFRRLARSCANCANCATLAGHGKWSRRGSHPRDKVSSLDRPALAGGPRYCQRVARLVIVETRHPLRFILHDAALPNHRRRQLHRRDYVVTRTSYAISLRYSTGSVRMILRSASRKM